MGSAGLSNQITVKKEQIEETPFLIPLPPQMIDVSLRQVILIAIEEGRLTMRQLMAGFQSKQLANGKYSYSVDVTDWRKIDETLRRPEDASHPSLHQFANVAEVEETDAYIRLHPQQVLQSLLQRAWAAYPNAVGPPFSIAHVYLSSDSPSGIKVTWLSQGNCPSWNFRPRTPSYIK